MSERRRMMFHQRQELEVVPCKQLVQVYSQYSHGEETFTRWDQTYTSGYNSPPSYNNANIHYNIRATIMKIRFSGWGQVPYMYATLTAENGTSYTYVNTAYPKDQFVDVDIAGIFGGSPIVKVKTYIRNEGNYNSINVQCNTTILQ